MTATALALTPAATEAQTLRVIARSFAPDPVLTPAEWAARYYVLPQRGSAKPGPWRHENAPFGVGILDALAPAAPWEKVVFMAPAQVIKALALDTPLPTPTGWTTMGAVQVGDTLLDEHGQPTRVLGVSEIFVDRPCYAVVFSDRSVIVAGEDHRWPVRRAGVASIATTAEIRDAYATFGVERFFVDEECRQGGRRRMIWAVVPVPSVPLRCLAVDSPSHLFLAGAGMIPTHNTELALVLIGFIIHQTPGPALAVQPTTTAVKRFSQQRVQAMIDSTPCLRGVVAHQGTRDGGNTLQLKLFPNGALGVASARSPADLSQMPVKFLILDEVDRYPQTLGEEGDPIALAEYRTEQFPGGKIYECSTPLVAGTSRIAADLAACDVELHFHVPCPDCGHRQALAFERLVWPDGQPDLAAYQCAGCQTLIPHRAKPAMVRAGQWTAIRDNGSRKSVGFHLNRLYALMGKTTWAKLARRIVLAREDPRMLRTVTNLDQALPFAESHDRPDWRRLYERRESYEQGVVPHGVVELVLGVDCQADRIEAQLVGFGRGMERWSVGYYVLDGDPATPGVLAQLDPLLMRDWPCEGGGTLPVHLLAIDAGYKSQHVYAWARTHADQPVTGPTGVSVPKMRSVAVIQGKDFWDQAFRTPRTLEGTRKRKGIKLFQVGVSGLKAEVYAALKLEAPTDQEWAAGKGFPGRYIHFPEYDQPFFEGLVAEECRSRVTRRGEVKLEWVNPAGMRNEPLDTLVYAYAAMAMIGAPRWSDKKWAARERARYGDAGRPRVRAAVSTPTVTAPAKLPRVALAELPPPAVESPAPVPAVVRPHRRRVRPSSWVQRMMRR